MPLIFSNAPGAHERRLQRLANNPLFPEPKRAVTQLDVTAALAEDQDELRAFLTDFQGLVQKAVDLDPTVDSEIVLHLKEDLDKAYERCSSLMGEQQEIKNAITRLLDVVMAAVRKEAANDPLAIQKLADEDAARRAHFQLQGYAIVADLMREDNVIAEDELVPTLLSEPPESLAAALQLFDPVQLDLIAREARALLEARRADGVELTAAWQNLQAMETAAADSPTEHALNG